MEIYNLARKNDTRGKVEPLPMKCPPHIWVTTYDRVTVDPCGRICSKCGTIEGRLE